jgi:hypothetical protein
MDPIKDFLEIVKLAKAQTHRNLTLFPLLAPESGDPDYLVSCVEHGRWSYKSREFDSGEKIMHFSLRREHQREVSKNLREERSFRSNQGMIWDGLAERELILKQA